MTPWTKAQIAAVADMALDGLSGSQIADAIFQKFGRQTSRNAVIGLIARRKEFDGIGLKGKPPGVASGGTASSRAASAAAPSGAPAGRRTIDGPQSRPVGVQSSLGEACKHDRAPRLVARPARSEPQRGVSVKAMFITPMPFLRAASENRCLFFAADPMSAAGPDMPVCGCLRQTISRKPYCAAHLACEAA